VRYDPVAHGLDPGFEIGKPCSVWRRQFVQREFLMDRRDLRIEVVQSVDERSLFAVVQEAIVVERLFEFDPL